MCINSRTVWVTEANNYVTQDVACGQCWACRKNRQNDLIGRGMAEMAYSRGAVALTLTYGDDRLSKRQAYKKRRIDKSDLQNFLKRWRKSVGETKYIAAGEYGSVKGRTHFHAVLMTKGELPPMPSRENFRDLDLWPYGNMYADSVNLKALRYVIKYLTKTDEANSDEWVTYSKRPLLGHDFFVDLARRHAFEKVVPQNLNYFPPGYTGEPKLKFSMSGKAEAVFIDTLVQLWPDALTVPKSEWVENAFRRHARRIKRQEWGALPSARKNTILYKELKGGLDRARMERARKDGEEREKKHVERLYGAKRS